MRVLVSWGTGKDSARCLHAARRLADMWDGPMLDRPIAIQTGEVVLRGGFMFADLLPREAAAWRTLRAARR